MRRIVPVSARASRGHVQELVYVACVLLVGTLLFGDILAEARTRSAEDPIDPDAGQRARIEAREIDPGRVSFQVRLPAAALQIDTTDTGRRRVRVADLQKVSTPGLPELPVAVVSLAVPEGARIALDWSAGPELRSAGLPLQPVAVYEPTTGAFREKENATVYSRATAWPAHRVEMEELRFRGLRVARLQIYPVRYSPTTHELSWTESVDVTVTFEGGRGYGRVGGRLGAAVDRVVARSLLNADVVGRWRAPLPGRGASPNPPAEKSSHPAARIRVDEPGIVRVTAAELTANGFPSSSVDPRNLELSYRGTSVPCRVVGEGDGSFDPADAVEFYGIPGDTRYSAENVYWLEEGTTAGLRFSTRDATPGAAALVTSFPHTEHFEPINDLYTVGRPSQDGDPHFYWRRFDTSNRTLIYNVTLPGVTSSGDAIFRALFFGRTDPASNPDHLIRFRVNGTVIGDASWNGTTFHEPDMPFSSSLLTGGSNALRLDWLFITNPDLYYLDWIEVEYPRLTQAVSNQLTVVSEGGSRRFDVTGFQSTADTLLLDVSDPYDPVELTGAAIDATSVEFEVDGPAGSSYAVASGSGRVAASGIENDTPSDLRAVTNGADLIIITPEGWESSMSALVAHRQAQGLRVVLANLTDVADEFAGGNEDDLAIHDFVSWAYFNWQPPAVSYVLLVGEPSYDPQNWLGSSPHHSYMPTRFTVTTFQGETISDTFFGAVDGTDLLPDVGIARFSVRSSSAAQSLATKVINYENTAPAGSGWTLDLVHVASDEVAFETSLETAAAELPTEFSVDTEYRLSGANATTIRNAINAGALMVSFVGHGNLPYWADNPGGPYFDTGDANALANGTRLPFVTALNCLNGLIGDPFTPDALAEVFHNPSNRGAVAMWSPSALGFLSQYDSVQRVFYEHVYQENVREFGASTTGSMVETFLTSTISIDLVKEMILLADPAGQLALECSGLDETCDGMDDDCDGTDDDDFMSEATICGIGACSSTGSTSCVAGQLQDSCVAGQPAADDTTCDGIDADCDGLADEDYVPQSTSCGIGACSAFGELQCVNGMVVNTCDPGTPAPDDATCDDVDDDCDGVADEDFSPQATNCGVGACASTGQTECIAGVLGDTCEAGQPAVDDASCNGVDDDCDGADDEDYATSATNCGVGACAATGDMQCVDGLEVDTCDPGTPAPEDATCDGVDDDCDSVADEDFAPDATNCGVGACASTGQTECIAGVLGDTCEAGQPAADDATCNGVDDDCDGADDEDYATSVTNCGVGACAATGEMQCIGGSEVDTCDPGTPAPEDATCDGVDDDCDSVADEDFAPDATNCGVGACASTGQTECIAGVLGDTCEAGQPAADDATCNGVDDDCDGADDEDYATSVTNCGVGACAATGEMQCIGGSEVDTCDPGTPAPDDATCDGVDDDCDSVADEDFAPDATNCGVGACASTGQTECIAGVLGDTCEAGQPAVDDASCNGVDDDCDGADDEDYATSATNCGVGACAATGEMQCVGGLEVDTCDPGTPAPDDATCDGIDDDCDSVADEDFAPDATNCGVGACASTGQTECIAGVLGDTCEAGEPAADDATCNGVDDDCDGADDEDYATSATNCGVGACAATGEMQCVGGLEVDTCDPGTPAPDDATCDGIDDDCDSVADEDFAPDATNCGVGACASTGQTECIAGVLGDTCEAGEPAADDATCNGVDDDCDGVDDENYAAQSTQCGVGECQRSGQLECVAGAQVDTCQEGLPRTESCNGVDDDCDGATDEADAVDATTWYADTDGDGFGDPGSSVLSCTQPQDHVADATDCDDGDGASWATPGEATSLLFTDKSVLTWTPPQQQGTQNLTTHGLRTALSSDFTSAACIAQISTNVVLDGIVPPSQVVYFYLILAHNSCPDGDGSLGSDSFGTERQGVSCSP